MGFRPMGLRMLATASYAAAACPLKAEATACRWRRMHRHHDINSNLSGLKVVELAHWARCRRIATSSGWFNDRTGIDGQPAGLRPVATKARRLE